MGLTRNHRAEHTHWRDAEVKVIDGLAVRFSDVCVHEFVMGDVEDPDLMAGAPIWEWQQSEAGCWVMEHAVEQPYWVRQHDFNSFGYKYRILARLSDADQIFFKLKFK